MFVYVCFVRSLERTKAKCEDLKTTIHKNRWKELQNIIYYMYVFHKNKS